MSLFSLVLKYVWPQIKKRQWIFYIILIFYTIRIFVDQIVIPLFFKRIIDVFSSSGFANPSVAPILYNLVFIIIGTHIFLFIIARVTKFTVFKFEIEVIRDLRDYAFQKIEQNSHTFFANTFAGSLVTKVRRFVGGFETAFDIFMYNFLKFFVILGGVLVIFIFQSPEIALIFGILVTV